MNKREKICIAVMGAAAALFFVYEFFFATPPTDTQTVSVMADMTVTRLLGGIVFLAVIVYLEIPILRPFRRPFWHTVWVTLPFWIVALNNLPFLSLLRGDAYLDAPAWMYVLLAAQYFAVALFEECAFRGVLLPLLLQRKPDSPRHTVRCLLLSSLIFGLIHAVNLFYGAAPGAVLLQMGYSFLIGGMCGIAMLLSGDIWMAVGLHMVYDICGQMVPTLGGGKIWTLPTVILTAAVGTAVTVYALYLLTHAEKMTLRRDV